MFVDFRFYPGLRVGRVVYVVRNLESVINAGYYQTTSDGAIDV